jgi:cell pole-organizing protein PopZ
MSVQSPLQVPAQSVEEILASIRQAIAADETRRGRTMTALAPPASSPPAPARGNGNAGRNFVSANDDDDWGVAPDFETQNVIELAIEKAIDGVSAALAAETESDARRVSGDAVESDMRGQSDALREERRADGRPLLSAQAGAAVAASFEDLARSVADLSPAEIRAMAQDALRPMLKGWLDDNLPSLVERLVRDEIERVSRGR